MDAGRAFEKNGAFPKILEFRRLLLGLFVNVPGGTARRGLEYLLLFPGITIVGLGKIGLLALLTSIKLLTGEELLLTGERFKDIP
jgi:hypothetical protein